MVDFLFELLDKFKPKGFIIYWDEIEDGYTIVLGVSLVSSGYVIKFLVEERLHIFSSVCVVNGSYKSFFSLLESQINNPDILVFGFSEYFKEYSKSLRPCFCFPQWILPFIDLSFFYERDLYRAQIDQKGRAHFFIKGVQLKSYLSVIKYILLLCGIFDLRGLYVSHSFRGNGVKFFSFFVEVNLTNNNNLNKVSKDIIKLASSHNYQIVRPVKSSKESVRYFLSIKTPVLHYGFGKN